MMGLDMLLSSLGIDPEKIKQEIESFAKMTKETLTNIDSKLSQIHTEQKWIAEKILSIEQRLDGRTNPHGNILSSGDTTSSSS